MKCEICKENEVEIKTRAIINGKIKEIFVCQSCIKKYKIQTITKPKYTDYLKLLIEEISDKKKKLICKNCKTTYTDFAKEGKAGCPFCYFYFSEILKKLLKDFTPPQYLKSIEEFIEKSNETDPYKILKKIDTYLSFDDVDMAKKHLKKLKRVDKNDT